MSTPLWWCINTGKLGTRDPSLSMNQRKRARNNTINGDRPDVRRPYKCYNNRSLFVKHARYTIQKPELWLFSLFSLWACFWTGASRHWLQNQAQNENTAWNGGCKVINMTLLRTIFEWLLTPAKRTMIHARTNKYRKSQSKETELFNYSGSWLLNIRGVQIFFSPLSCNARQTKTLRLHPVPCPLGKVICH